MVIDTSAIVAIVANEPERDLFMARLQDAPARRISAASTVELTIVLSNKRDHRAASDVAALLDGLTILVEPVTSEQAALARRAFLTYGNGRHPARLNFGDCFSYALAMHLGEPLLYKGADFAQTDVRSALAA